LKQLLEKNWLDAGLIAALRSAEDFFPGGATFLDMSGCSYSPESSPATDLTSGAAAPATTGSRSLERMVLLWTW